MIEVSPQTIVELRALIVDLTIERETIEAKVGAIDRGIATLDQLIAFYDEEGGDEPLFRPNQMAAARVLMRRSPRVAAPVAGEALCCTT